MTVFNRDGLTLVWANTPHYNHIPFPKYVRSDEKSVKNNEANLLID